MAIRACLCQLPSLQVWGQQEGAQRTDFQLTRAGYGSSCKDFSFRWRGNFSTSGGWCCASCSYFGGTFFFHMWILGQSKIFLLGILGLPFVMLLLYRDSLSSSGFLWGSFALTQRRISHIRWQILVWQAGVNLESFQGSNWIKLWQRIALLFLDTKLSMISF